MATLKQHIINELNAIVFSQDNPDQNSDLSYKAISTGIFNYLSDADNYSWPIATTTGSYTIAGPTPVAVPPEPMEDSTLNLPPLGQPDLETKLKTFTRNGFDLNNMKDFFRAIFQWTLPTTLTLGGKSGEGTVVFDYILPMGTGPHGSVLFPSFEIYGPLCQTELDSTDFVGNHEEINDQIWTIICKHIGSGLNGNVIPPIPTTAIVNPSPPAITPYAGITTMTLQFDNLY